MKSISFLLNLFVLIVCMFALTGCPDPAVETEADKAKRLLTSGGTWTLQSAVVDGVDRTSVYQNLKVTFSASSFTVTSGGAVWPATGTWSTTDGKVITRNDGLAITIDELSETRAVLSFTWTKTTYGPGRVESVSGHHVFTFTK